MAVDRSAWCTCSLTELHSVPAHWHASCGFTVAELHAVPIHWHVCMVCLFTDMTPAVLLLTGLHGVPVHSKVAWCTCLLTELHAIPVYWQDFMLYLFIGRTGYCTFLLKGLHGVPVHWHSPFGFTVDRVAWCTCSLTFPLWFYCWQGCMVYLFIDIPPLVLLLTGLHGVPVHWQDCMLFLFINRFAWCTCSLTGLHNVPVHWQDCMLYLFIDMIVCCTCSLTRMHAVPVHWQDCIYLLTGLHAVPIHWHTPVVSLSTGLHSCLIRFLPWCRWKSIDTEKCSDRKTHIFWWKVSLFDTNHFLFLLQKSYSLLPWPVPSLFQNQQVVMFRAQLLTNCH